MERMLSSFLIRTSRAEVLEIKKNQISEESLISAINNFFTDNINLLITACLVYFTLFAGFTRMRNKHMALAVPTAAIWTVLQAKALIGTMAAATGVIALAKAYFAWQGTSATEVATDMASRGVTTLVETLVNNRGTAENVVSLGQTVLGKPSDTSATSQLFQEQITAPRQQTETSPKLREMVETVLPTQTSAKEASKLFERKTTGQIVLPTSTLPHDSENVDGFLEEYLAEIDLEEKASQTSLPTQQPVETSGLSSVQVEEVLGHGTELSTIPADQLHIFDQAWNEGAKNIAAKLTTKEMNTFNQAWSEVSKKFSTAPASDEMVKEFLELQCKQKGLPWGKIGMIALGCVAVSYTAYKIWEASNSTEETEEEKQVTDVMKSTMYCDDDIEQEESPETGVLGWLGYALTAICPDDDSDYRSENEEYKLFAL